MGNLFAVVGGARTLVATRRREQRRGVWCREVRVRVRSRLWVCARASLEGGCAGRGSIEGGREMGRCEWLAGGEGG